ncbi:MAG: TIR domain-containing protein [Actinomycetota bacterium]
MTELRYMYFLAHEGRDTERAKELRNLLHPDVPVFLDACDLVPGEEWDVELPRRQRQARATVALLSASTEAAYYLREEIASAIAYQRHEPDTHRLIPVYLDGVPKDPTQIQYGMRVRHALDAARLGMVGVAAELKKAATALTIAPSPSLPSDMPEPAERIAIFDALCTFLPSMFDEIVFHVNAPKQHLAPTSEPLARRALDLVQWAEQGGSTRMNGLYNAIRKVASGERAGAARKVFILPPVDTEGFAGRKTELQRLTDLLINGTPPAGGRIAGVYGAPGVGKSRLAVHFAKTERERFPGGVLGVDLRGVEDPADAISRLATAQGEPLTSEEQVRPLHEIMQARFADRRCLLVLDNLEHGSALKQIKPGGQAAVLITCRNQEVLAQFAVPAANRIPLGALSPDDARQYLEIAFGHRTHSAAELDSLARHVRYLPLALRIAARRLLEDPLEKGRIGRFLQRLRDADDPLGELVVDGEADLDLIRSSPSAWSTCRNRASEHSPA